MSILLETTLGDIVIDLDVDGSTELCKNILKLVKVRYYTSCLIYNIQYNRFIQFGDPIGDGTGGSCIYGLLDVYNRDESTTTDVIHSTKRFMKSSMGRILTKQECQEKGRVVAIEMNGITDTIGSQLLITIDNGPDKALDGYTYPNNGNTNTNTNFRSIGQVVEDPDNVLDQLATTYCDTNGRPYADIRIIRALIIDDPFDDPLGLKEVMKQRGIEFDDNDNDMVIQSPDYEYPPEEIVERRIQANQIDLADNDIDDELYIKQQQEQQEQILQKQDQSRAVVLEMLGDLPSANIRTPENVLFVCKLNSITEDEDLELIFSRFDTNVKVNIIRDHETGDSLQYAFIEFTTKQQAIDAYFKMNNTLIDDRRIKIDFSQSVAKIWDKYNQRQKNNNNNNNNNDKNIVIMPRYNPLTYGENDNNNNDTRHQNKRKYHDRNDDGKQRSQQSDKSSRQESHHHRQRHHHYHDHRPKTTMMYRTNDTGRHHHHEQQQQQHYDDSRYTRQDRERHHRHRDNNDKDKGHSNEKRYRQEDIDDGNRRRADSRSESPRRRNDRRRYDSDDDDVEEEESLKDGSDSRSDSISDDGKGRSRKDKRHHRHRRRRRSRKDSSKERKHRKHKKNKRK